MDKQIKSRAYYLNLELIMVSIASIFMGAAATTAVIILMGGH